MSEREKFEVGRNRCNCHPETCCCNDWAIYTHKGDTHSTHYSKEVAEEICRALNKVAESAAEIAVLRTELEEARKDAERLREAADELLSNEEHRIGACGAGYAKGSQTDKLWQALKRAAIDAAKEHGK